jgi:hypothetical protein
MAHVLMETGPLSIALNALLLQFYRSGVFDPVMCNPKNLDHGKQWKYGYLLQSGMVVGACVCGEDDPCNGVGFSCGLIEAAAPRACWLRFEKNLPDLWFEGAALFV